MPNQTDFFTSLPEKHTFSPEKRELILAEYKQRLSNDLFADRLLQKLTQEGFFQQGKETIADALSYLHNAGFWETHLQDGNSLHNLEIHNLGDVERKRAEEKFLKQIPRYIVGELVRYRVKRRYNPQFNHMSAEEEQLIQQSLQEVLAGKNTFIVTNHETFGNIPVIIMKYMTVAHKLKIKNVNQYLYTILWPLLMTHRRQKLLINMLSNIVVTQPAHKPSEALKEAYSEQRGLAAKKIKSDFSLLPPETSDPSFSKPEPSTGKIYLCSPSGTRDVVLRLKNGQPVIYLPDESQASNKLTYALTKEIKKAGARVLLLWTNTTALKKGIAPANNDRNKNAPIEMHLKNVELAEELSAKNAISELQSLVMQDGEVIAKTLPADLFKRVKKLQKSGELEQYLWEDGDLDREKLERTLQKNSPKMGLPNEM